MRAAGTLNMLGRVWDFFWAAGEDRPLVSSHACARPMRRSMEPMGPSDLGSCDEPWLVGKRIIIRDCLTPEQTLDTFIHELLHAAGWAVLDESWVSETATDMTQNILKHFDVSQRTTDRSG